MFLARIFFVGMFFLDFFFLSRVKIGAGFFDIHRLNAIKTGLDRSVEVSH